MGPESPETQVFTVIVRWSPVSESRVTEGDIREIVEELVSEIDEDATVEIEENMDHGY